MADFDNAVRNNMSNIAGLQANQMFEAQRQQAPQKVFVIVRNDGEVLEAFGSLRLAEIFKRGARSAFRDGGDLVVKIVELTVQH
jgi:hypothetical protein